MRMLIISCPWALLGSRVLINVSISSQEKVITEIGLSVVFFWENLKEFYESYLF